MHSHAGDATYWVTPGFPIQKSPDQSLFTNSPELIAGYNVFHRLWTPRHPPCTLNELDHIDELLPKRNLTGRPEAVPKTTIAHRVTKLLFGALFPPTAPRSLEAPSTKTLVL